MENMAKRGLSCVKKYQPSQGRRLNESEEVYRLPGIRESEAGSVVDYLYVLKRGVAVPTITVKVFVEVGERTMWVCTLVYGEHSWELAYVNKQALKMLRRRGRKIRRPFGQPLLERFAHLDREFGYQITDDLMANIHENGGHVRYNCARLLRDSSVELMERDNYEDDCLEVPAHLK